MTLQSNVPSRPARGVTGYVRRSSHMQAGNFSIDAQKRGIREACQRRGLPKPIFFEDDERSARGE